MEKLSITAKLQIITSKADKEKLDATMSAYRNACNFVSDYVSKTHKLSLSALNKALYRSIRSKFGLGSQMSQSVLKTVISQYKTILKSKRQWIKPIFKKPQYDLVWNRDYSLNSQVFSVSTLSGRLKLPYCASGMEKYFNRDIYKFGTAKLVHKHGKYFLHISVTRNIEKCSLDDVCCVVGIDRGINFVVATYDSNQKSSFVSGKQIKQKRAQYAKTRKQLQKIGTPSSRRRLKAIGSRENRWMQDVNHQVSKALVEKYPKHTLFVLEDLTDIRNATERVKLKNRYVSVSWSFYDLEQKLTYKATQNQSLVLKVDPAYTSQTCPICNHTEKANRNKKLHLFCCKKCGYKSNDDRVGAMNLYRLGINHLSVAKSQQNSVSDTVPDTVTTK